MFDLNYRKCSFCYKKVICYTNIPLSVKIFDLNIAAAN